MNICTECNGPIEPERIALGHYVDRYKEADETELKFLGRKWVGPTTCRWCAENVTHDVLDHRSVVHSVKSKGPGANVEESSGRGGGTRPLDYILDAEGNLVEAPRSTPVGRNGTVHSFYGPDRNGWERPATDDSGIAYAAVSWAQGGEPPMGRTELPAETLEALEAIAQLRKAGRYNAAAVLAEGIIVHCEQGVGAFTGRWTDDGQPIYYVASVPEDRGRGVQTAGLVGNHGIGRHVQLDGPTVRRRHGVQGP